MAESKLKIQVKNSRDEIVTEGDMLEGTLIVKDNKGKHYILSSCADIWTFEGITPEDNNPSKSCTE